MHEVEMIGILSYEENNENNTRFAGQLVEHAMQVCHQKTKTAVIIAALQDLVRKARLQELRQFKGRVDLHINLDTLRKRT